MQVPVYGLAGEVINQVELSEEVFGVPFNEAVVHQAMVMQMANRRQGTASTKSRSEVRGSTRKLYAQKHTGRARRGDIKSPLLRGGGVAFGPKPRLYRQSMPKGMRRLALKCVLSSKIREENLKVIEKFAFEEPRTKDVVDMLAAVGVDSTALIVSEHSNPNMIKSARNLANVKTLPSSLVNVLDLLSYKALVISVPALYNIDRIWGSRSN
ncbi:MAG: 50S ribosomal protein L4 [Dehalococcoidia bacterium]|nr:50S ribosomal protein L4 [Dehalococcoidia bacterium]